MNAFEQRQSKGAILQQQFVDFLEKNNIKYMLTGYENLANINQDALNAIRRNKDKTSFFVRHYPDITLVFSNVSILVECKNSSGIEYHAYHNYLSLRKEFGIDVLLYLKNNRLCRIEKLPLIKPHPFCNVSKMNIPIRDTYFRDATQLPKSDYYKYLKAYKNRTSGNPFSFIDLDTSHPSYITIDALADLSKTLP